MDALLRDFQNRRLGDSCGWHFPILAAVISESGEMPSCAPRDRIVLELRTKTLFDDTIQPLLYPVALKVFTKRCDGVPCRVSAGTFHIRMTRNVVRCRFAEGYSPSRKQLFQDLNDGGRRHRTGCSCLWPLRVYTVYHYKRSLTVWCNLVSQATRPIYGIATSLLSSYDPWMTLVGHVQYQLLELRQRTVVLHQVSDIRRLDSISRVAPCCRDVVPVEAARRSHVSFYFTNRGGRHSKQIPYQVVDIANNRMAKRRMRHMSMDENAVPPRIFHGEIYLGDYFEFQEALVQKRLDEFLTKLSH
ncbi:hypothetical protein LSAT2_030217 [Lamellibrachia satsuma]|nr:hypothetical protein LSAT2_030217 [Lamellibrachia satsuma]